MSETRRGPVTAQDLRTELRRLGVFMPESVVEKRRANLSDARLESDERLWFRKAVWALRFLDSGDLFGVAVLVNLLHQEDWDQAMSALSGSGGEEESGV